MGASLTDIGVFGLCAVLAVGGILAILRFVFMRLRPKTQFTSASMVERVRAVGRLVSLQVCTKEIVTSQTGLSWIPEIILSKRKLALIFDFEKEYFVDLTRLKTEDVQRIGEQRYRITLPPIEGVERMTNVLPYDVQGGKFLLLLEVLPNDADAQREATDRARAQAIQLFRLRDEQYAAQARASAEHQVKALLAMFEVDADVAWATRPAAEHALAASSSGA